MKKSFFRPGPPSRPRLFAVGLLLVVLSSLGLTVSASLASASVTERELSVHRLVNEHRAAQGLTPLALSPEISAIARAHSEDMASERVGVGHDGFGRRSAQSGGAAENVAFNRTDRGAVSSWLSSPGHRRNIEGHYNLTGIGIARHPYRGYYFTQLFTWGSVGRLPTSPPPSASPLPEPTGEAVTAALELSVHRLVNEHRAAQGLTPLALSPEISAIARVHSEDMASGRAAGGHAGADARAERISHSIPYREFGENVAAINQGGEGEAAVSGWLQSPGHRSNIEGSFDLTGIGIARSEDGTYFFTQLFVTPATHSSPVPLPTPEPAHSPEVQPPPAEVDAAPSLFAQLAWALLGLAWELWGFAVDLLWGLAGDLFAPAAPPLTVDPPAVTPAAVPPPVPQPAHSPGAHPTSIAVDPPPHSSVPALPGPLAPPAAALRVPQTYGSRPAYNYKPPSRNHRPEKDPRERPGRRRTMDGWVQKLE